MHRISFASKFFCSRQCRFLFARRHPARAHVHAFARACKRLRTDMHALLRERTHTHTYHIRRVARRPVPVCKYYTYTLRCVRARRSPNQSARARDCVYIRHVYSSKGISPWLVRACVGGAPVNTLCMCTYIYRTNEVCVSARARAPSVHMFWCACASFTDGAPRHGGTACIWGSVAAARAAEQSEHDTVAHTTTTSSTREHRCARPHRRHRRQSLLH